MESLRLQGLGEAHDIAALFPFVRPIGEAIAALADRAAQDGTVTQEAVDDGLGLLEAGERRRLLDSFASRYPDRWTRVVAAAGDIEAAERALVTGAVRATIAERLLPPRRPRGGGAADGRARHAREDPALPSCHPRTCGRWTM